METVRTKLEALGYGPTEWQLPVTEEFVVAFEREYGLQLPTEYRAFLLAFSGWAGSATCDFLEQPTPLGDGGWIGLFYGNTVPEYHVYDIRWATNSVGGAPAFVAVATGGMNGCMVVIRCGSQDDGYVYFLDADQRSLWADEDFHRMFPGLDTRIKEYLAQRRVKELPSKPEGYESLYLMARGFNEFIDRLVSTSDESA